MDGSGAPDRRTERVVFRTGRHQVVGDVTLPPEGYKSRFSDVLNGETNFIAVKDVEITPLEGGEVETRPFVVLGKAHIQLAYPLGEPA